MEEFKYYVVYKPYNMLSQFTSQLGKKTLADIPFNFPKEVYAVGRIDEDSEGILILTDDKTLNNKLLNPKYEHYRTYLAQVEGIATIEATKLLEKGVEISVEGKKYFTKKAKVEIIEDPENLPERSIPIRFRKNVPTSWIKLSIIEGKNRQVRKMTAAVGLPTLRLIRTKIEDLELAQLKNGFVEDVDRETIYKLLKIKQL